MSGFQTITIEGDETRVKTESGRPMLETEVRPLEFFIARAEENYMQDRADFFNTLADEAVLTEKARRWQKSATEYMRWAGTLFNADPYDQDQRLLALSIMEKITQESALRHQNICLHADLAAASEPNDQSTRDRVKKAESGTDAFLRSAIRTKIRFNELFRKGENYVSPEVASDYEASVWYKELRDRDILPKDHIYIPGRVIPPYTVPEGERVPELPAAYEAVMTQPAEAYEFDPEIDELVLRKGYVSPDGLVDDESLVIDPEAGTAAMKFRGEPPEKAVIWNWWKAKDLTDVPPADSWVFQYLSRLYRQTYQEKARGPKPLKVSGDCFG